VTADRQGDARGLECALRTLGVACEVEARAALALIVASPTDAARLASDQLRAQALVLAREHGFTHVAVELLAAPRDGHAPLLRH
jgi:hypothetical protein